MVNHLVGVVRVGDTVVNYNKWNGFENSAIDNCFFRMTEDDKKSLKRGDLIWRNEEPYCRHGKIDGYTLRRISNVSKDGSKTVIQMGEVSFILEDDLNSYKVIPEDEKKLITLIEENPKCFSLGYE